MTQPLYLDYPAQADGLRQPRRVPYGPDMLVAPVTTPGNVTTEHGLVPAGDVDRLVHRRHVPGPVHPDAHRAPGPDAGLRQGRRHRPRAGADGPRRRASPAPRSTLRVYPGRTGTFTLYQDAGSGTGYQKGQYSLTPISTRHGGERHHRRHRPAAAAATRASRPPGASGSTWSASAARGRCCSTAGRSPPATGPTTRRPTPSTVTVSGLAAAAGAQVTEIGGSSVAQAEPAAVDLSIDPATPLSLSPGQTATVTTTEHNDGPGDANGTAVTLSAPSGWTVNPSGPVSAGTIAAGASATQSWTVQAPASSSASPQTASLQAQASYTSAGEQEQVTAAEQAPPAHGAAPAAGDHPVTPSTTAAGTSVTLTGQNFGATQGSSYLTLAQGGTSWGAPYDGAKLTITSWSDTSITVHPAAGHRAVPARTRARHHHGQRRRPDVAGRRSRSAAPSRRRR